MAKFSNIIDSEIPVLVDFYADWCAPCRMMPPILKEVKDHFGDKVKVIKVDVDKNQKIAAQYQIRSIPSIMLFKNSQILWSATGVNPARTLKKVINKHI